MTIDREAGAGKSTLAKHLGYAALARGYTVCFSSLAAALDDLLQHKTLPAVERRLRRYTMPNLLILDELGYVSCPPDAADLLFRIVTTRHEQRSIVITTNLAYKFAIQEGGWMFDHWELEVTKIKKNAFRVSYVNPKDGQVVLDSEDLTRTDKGHGQMQQGVVHEFGHMIGLLDEYPTTGAHAGDHSSVMNRGMGTRHRHDSGPRDCTRPARSPPARSRHRTDQRAGRAARHVPGGPTENGELRLPRSHVEHGRRPVSALHSSMKRIHRLDGGACSNCRGCTR